MYFSCIFKEYHIFYCYCVDKKNDANTLNTNEKEIRRGDADDRLGS